MNPIIVIGFVALISLGLGGMYAVIESQSELATLQQQALQRTAHANTPNLIKAELYGNNDNNTIAHILISNNNPNGPAKLIQLRVYENNTLIDSWDIANVVVPPLHTLNLSTSIIGEIPHGIHAYLLSTINITNSDTKYNYKGITSQGIIFDIDTDIHLLRHLAQDMGSGIGQSNVYGQLTLMTIDGGRQEITSDRTLELYHATRESCESGHNHIKYVVLITENPRKITFPNGDEPTSDYNYDGGWSHHDSGESRKYVIWESEHGLIPGQRATLGDCNVLANSLGTGIDVDVNPLNLKVYKGNTWLLGWRITNPANYNIAVDLKLHSTPINMPNDRVGLSVSVPVEHYDAGAVYRVDMSGQCAYASNRGCHCFTPDAGRQKIAEIVKTLSKPTITTTISVDTAVNKNQPFTIHDSETIHHNKLVHTVNVDGVKFYWALKATNNPNHGPLMTWTLASKYNTNAALPQARTCLYFMQGEIHSHWKYDDTINRIFDVDATKIIDQELLRVSNSIVIDYSPSASSTSVITKSYGSMVVGNSTITVGKR